MRILVTGATGFLGGPLVAALVNAGHAVRAAVRRLSDVRLPDSVSLALSPDLGQAAGWDELVVGVDIIVHLGGIAHAGPGIPNLRYDLVNRHGTALLAAAAARSGVSRFVFASSIRAQTGPAADHVLTEADEARPTDAYGRSKLAAEVAVRASGVPFTILRPVVIYGPNVKGNIATLARLARWPLPLPFGAFRNRRSLLSIDAMLGAIQFVITSPVAAGETYIVADERPVTLAAVIAALRGAAGRAPMLVPIPPALFRGAANAIGRSDLWDRIGGELIAEPTKLITAGWKAEYDTCAALTRLHRV